MNHLAELQPRLARVVECRFFGGLTEEEIAEALGVTVRTVQRDWAKARMLLQRELRHDSRYRAHRPAAAAGSRSTGWFRLYHELRAIARQRLASQRARTLQTTALVHEAWLKVVDQSQANVRDRAHFLALASLAMRHLLIDRAKAKASHKRGGARWHVTFDEELIGAADQPEVLLQLDEALNQLAELEPRLARVVECRFFGGMTEDEIAEALGTNVRTVQRDWVKARVVLRRMLEP
jgi:RNA polymerase sigma factor (TIGR02999 family)